MFTARFNLSNQLVKECEQALEESFDKTKGAFDSNAKPNKLSIGEVFYLETTQRGLLHHKFAEKYKGPYKIIRYKIEQNY